MFTLNLSHIIYIHLTSMPIYTNLRSNTLTRHSEYNMIHLARSSNLGESSEQLYLFYRSSLDDHAFC